MSSSNPSGTDHTRRRTRTGCCGSRGRGAKWSGFNIAAMVLGFMLFWPIGLLVLLWIVAGRDVQELPDSIRRLWAGVVGAWEGQQRTAAHGPGDNQVFNEFQQAQHERIREIKEEIRDRARRFADFRARAKRRSDEEEFDRFMSDKPVRGEG